MKKRLDGLYICQVSLGKDVNGKYKLKSFYGKTQREAKQKAEEFRLRNSTPNTDFSSVVALYLSFEEQRISYPRFKTKRARIGIFLQEFGNKNINLILPKDIQLIIDRLAYTNPRTGKPTAKQTLGQYLSTVSAVFEFAKKNRILAVNPCEYVSIPSGAPKTKRTALSEEERKKIELCGNPRAWIPTVLMYTGLRLGEATALLWSDVDLKEKTITVNKSYNFKEMETKAPKTESGIRIVPVPDKLIPILAEHKSKGNVFKTVNKNKQMTQQAWRRLKDTIEYSSGVKFEWHQLRHTYASVLYTAGVDVLTASKILGHADVKTTMAIYTHLEESKKRLSIDKLNEFLT